MSTSEQKFIVDRSQAEIAAYTLGESGPWVCFVNGHTRPASDFRAFMRQIVGRGFRTITLDNRGAGLTRYQGAFSQVDLVEDIKAVLDSQKISSCHLLGISMGGVLVQNFAALWPESYRSLALVSTTCSDRFLLTDHSPWSEDLATVIRKMQPYFSESFFQRNKLLIESMCKQILKNIAEGKFIEGAALQRDAILSYDTKDFLERLHKPIMVLHGSVDGVIDPGVVSAFRALKPDVRAKIYEGVGHLLLAECPKNLYTDYADFLADIGK